MVLLTAFAIYALWDTRQIYQEADKANYAVYKPTVENEGKTFKELQALNPEVIAWLTVYGTNIDYPVAQGRNNLKYVNIDAEGRHSISGAIFLDFQNSRDFSDFNSILFGHHMEKQKMFGEIGGFSDRNVFDAHKYGNLYYEDRDHGIVFFEFVSCDAYDKSVFTPNIMGDEARQVYLDELIEKAIQKRDVSVSIGDHIILLSTCSQDSTNGRDVLIGKIMDEVYEDPFIGADTNDKMEPAGVDRQAVGFGGIRWLLRLVLISAALILAVVLVNNNEKRKCGKNAKKE